MAVPAKKKIVTGPNHFPAVFPGHRSGKNVFSGPAAFPSGGAHFFLRLSLRGGPIFFPLGASGARGWSASGDFFGDDFGPA